MRVYACARVCMNEFDIRMCLFVGVGMCMCEILNHRLSVKSVCQHIGCVLLKFVEHGNLAVECQTLNRIPFAAALKLGHFRSLHDAPVHSAL